MTTFIVLHINRCKVWKKEFAEGEDHFTEPTPRRILVSSLFEYNRSGIGGGSCINIKTSPSVVSDDVVWQHATESPEEIDALVERAQGAVIKGDTK